MKSFAGALIVGTVMLVLAWQAHADVRLPSVFADHMVLQQGRPVPVWGWAGAGEEVKVAFHNQVQVTKADPNGAWRVELQALAASAQPAELTVTGGNTISVRDVLVGEVWICSGQSNMQWSVSQAGNAEQEIKTANLPQVRMFSVERGTAMLLQDDCKGAWKLATPENVGQFSAVGYFFGRYLHQVLKVPVGLLHTSWGGTRIEAWTSQAALSERPCAREMLADWEKVRSSWDGQKEMAAFELRKAAWQTEANKIAAENAALPPGKPKRNPPPAPRPPEDPSKSPHYPSALFNAMVAPLAPYAVQGVVWYQGESNQKRAFQYQELLPNMIHDWRKHWGSEFSFYIVQLASFGNGHPPVSDAGVPDSWAELQEAQLLTALTLPKCGLVVTNDLGEQNNIHPKNKQEVGRRLGLWALANDYGRKDLVFSGPLYKSSLTADGKVRVQFDHVGRGLKTRDERDPGAFQIAGADGVWHWAEAKIDGNEVVVSSAKVPKPVGVRYAWNGWPQGANLISSEGLPASCFRTDDFLPSTLGVVSPFAESSAVTPSKSR